MTAIQRHKPYPFKRETDPEIIEKILKHPYFIKKREDAIELVRRVGLPDFEKLKRESDQS